jgi:flagellar biosynthesis/type III secretory pathway chaperone
MNVISDEKKLLYHQTLSLWEDFCRLHKQLFELTCDEYMTLLASDIEQLENILPKKEELIQQISLAENSRIALMQQINERNVFPKKINKASELITAFGDVELNQGLPALKNLNLLLIDIIEKIQDQNKKNQLFLNKAMISLRELKQGFSGKKVFTTYGADGLTRTIGR